MDEEFVRLMSLSGRWKSSSVLSCSHSEKSFLGESFTVMISLFLRVCKSFGMSIMLAVLLLYGGEWCRPEAGEGDTTTKKLQNFNLSMISLVDFWICIGFSAVCSWWTWWTSVFLVSIVLYFGKNAQNVQLIISCLHCSLC